MVAPVGTQGNPSFIDPFAPAPVSGGVGTKVGAGTPTADTPAAFIANAKIANQGKPGFDVFGNPVQGQPLPGGGAAAPAAEPTVATSANISEKTIPQNQQTLQGIAGQSGLILGGDGLARNSDGTLATAPTGAGPTPEGYWSFQGINYAKAPDVHVDPAVQDILDKMNANMAQSDATSASYIQSIKEQYQNLIKQQTQANAGQQAGIETSLLRAGSTRYSPISSAGIANTQMSYGLNQIADLTTKMNQAVITAQQAQQSNNQKLLDSQLSIYQDLAKQKQDQMKQMSDVIAAQAKTHQEQADAAAKDSAVASILETGVTDPNQILKKLREQGNTTISAKDVADTIANLNPDAKNITDLMKTAAGNGASQDILKSIGQSKNFTEALTTAGLYASNATGDLGLYQNYVRQSQAQGKHPIPFESWQSMNEYNKAYATAKGTEAGKVAGAGTGGTGGLSQTSVTSRESFPQQLKPYARQSANGTWYLDLSSISSTQRDKYVQQAGDIPVISDTNQAADLVNIKDANGKLQTIATVMKDITSPSALSRNLGGAGLTALSKLAQTNPKAAAAEALNDSALDMLKALSGVQGFRGNQTAIQQIRDSLPKITDTQDVAAQKLSLIAQQISDRENATLGTRGSIDTTNFVIRSEDQAQKALIDFGNKNPDQQGTITKVMNETNPDTGQPYTYLETAQILGLDIPGAVGDPLSSVHGGLSAFGR